MWALSLSQGPAAGRAAHLLPAALLISSSFVFFLWVGRAFHAALGGPKLGHPSAHLSARHCVLAFRMPDLFNRTYAAMSCF